MENEAWVLEQLIRIERYQSIHRQEVAIAGEILFRGEPTTIRVMRANGWRGPNRVQNGPDGLLVQRSQTSQTLPATTLENWLRKQAKQDIVRLVEEIAPQVKRRPANIYVMGQRTKWGNCSAMGNLSFNWRLILAPEPVLRYLVTHEVVHLAVPDHSQRFWLTVQSLCPSSEWARRWLSANGDRLMVDLQAVVNRALDIDGK